MTNMDMMDVASSDGMQEQETAAAPLDCRHVFPFLRLPRELRDQVCLHTICTPPSSNELTLHVDLQLRFRSRR